MSDYMEYSQYYKKTWEDNLKEKNSNEFLKIHRAKFEEILEMEETRGYQKAQAEIAQLYERIEQLTMDVSHLKVQNDRLREAVKCLLKDISLTVDVSEAHTIERDCATVIESKNINKAIEALKGGE